MGSYSRQLTQKLTLLFFSSLQGRSTSVRTPDNTLFCLDLLFKVHQVSVIPAHVSSSLQCLVELTRWHPICTTLVRY